MSGFAFFDLDDTLVDQSGAVARWARHFIADRDLDPAAVDWLDVKGSTASSWRQFAAGFKEHFGLQDSIDDLVDEVVRTYPVYFTLADEVAEGLRRLRAAGFPLAIVTNGATAMQNAKIDRVGLRTLVDVVVVSESEGCRKPARLIFEKAAAKLGVELGRSGWMVGDSRAADVAGGLAAGLRTVWLANGRPQAVDDPEPEAEFRCDTVVQAIELILAA